MEFLIKHQTLLAMYVFGAFVNLLVYVIIKLVIVHCEDIYNACNKDVPMQISILFYLREKFTTLKKMFIIFWLGIGFFCFSIFLFFG